MAQFKAFAPGVEVNGQTVSSIIGGMGIFEESALKILAENGIPEPQPDQWYSQQAWLDAFKTIAETIGPATLRQIGIKIPERAKWPSNIDSIEHALASIDVAYHMNHRGGEIGHYDFRPMGPRSAEIVCSNPYPCEFDRGLIQAVARKFAPAGVIVIVDHDNSQSCRNNGAHACTYLISW